MESIQAPPVDGSTPLVFHLQEMCLLLRVSQLIIVVRTHTKQKTSSGHDSSINIVYPSGPVINIKISSLPFVTLTWTGENTLVAAGHDCQPVMFSGSEGGWQSIGSLDAATGSKSMDAGHGAGVNYGGSSSVGRLKTGAFATFRDADTRGQSSIPGSGLLTTDTQLLTVHQNTINSIRAYQGYPGQVSKVSTTGVDGKLVIWDIDAVVGGR